MSSSTTNYSFTLPAVNSAVDQDLWGGELNGNWTSIDSLLYTATNWVSSTKTTNYTVVSADNKMLLLVDATAGAVTVSLTAVASLFNGFTVAVKKIDSSANAVTIDANGSETIDGATTYVLADQNAGVIIAAKTSGSTWWAVASDAGNASTTARGVIRIATDAEVKTHTEAAKAVVPSSMYQHPGVAKGWVSFTGTTGAILQSYNVTSVVRNSLGFYTITWDSDFNDANYIVAASFFRAANDTQPDYIVTAQTAGACNLIIKDGNTLFDYTKVMVIAHGNAI